MLTRFAWLTVVALAAFAAAPPAFAAGAVATDLAIAACEESSQEPEPEPLPTRVILPCALAEHVLQHDSDPSCADAAIYVVTDAGVLLCQIDVSVLAAAKSPQIQKAPSATFSSSTAFSAAGIPAPGSSLPRPFVVELPRAPAPDVALACDGFARPPAVPS